VLALRIKEPDRPRPFRVPAVWLVAPLGAASCVYVMKGLPTTAWVRFGIWMAAGLVLYFVYGWRHSRLARSEEPPQRSSA
jgi:basic amino acid/polyamine antiporter, APA family